MQDTDSAQPGARGSFRPAGNLNLLSAGHCAAANADAHLYVPGPGRCHGLHLALGEPSVHIVITCPKAKLLKQTPIITPGVLCIGQSFSVQACTMCPIICNDVQPPYMPAHQMHVHGEQALVHIEHG